jgi:hypothetical protein
LSTDFPNTPEPSFEPSLTEHGTELLARIDARSARFGVMGLGYVGLPLSVAIEEASYHVLGLDVSREVVDWLNSGTSHVEDVEPHVVMGMRERGRFEATTDMSRLAECDVISICVPTPLSKTRDPDVSYVVAASRAVAAALRPGQLVILESTTYPGTTREVVLPLLEKTGLRVGRDFFLCFSPERVDPGNQVWQVRNTPKVHRRDHGGLCPDGVGGLRRGAGHGGARVQHGGGRAGQAAGEHLPGHQYRPGQRDGPGGRPPGRGHLGGDRRGGDQAVRVHEVHPGARDRRSLHSAGSSLSVVEDEDAQLPHAAHRGGQRDQRWRCPSTLWTRCARH